MLHGRDLAVFQILPKQYIPMNLIDADFLQVILPEANEFLGRSNSPLCETIGVFAWAVQTFLVICTAVEGIVSTMRSRLMVCRICEDFAWNIKNHLAVEEIWEGFVSDIPNHVVIYSTSEGFVSMRMLDPIIRQNPIGFNVGLMDVDRTPFGGLQNRWRFCIDYTKHSRLLYLVCRTL